MEDHCTHVATALEKLQEHKLYLNLKKCEFGRSKLSYLGHEISIQGVSAEADKIQAMVDWPNPKNIRGDFWVLRGITVNLLRGMPKLPFP